MPIAGGLQDKSYSGDYMCQNGHQSLTVAQMIPLACLGRAIDNSQWAWQKKVSKVACLIRSTSEVVMRR